MHNKPKAVIIGNEGSCPIVYSDEIVRGISEEVEWVCPPLLTHIYGNGDVSDVAIPSATEYIFGTWGMPQLDEKQLDRLPRLKGVFYAAGSVKCFVTDAVWQRGIRVFSAARANAVPVAEFTVAQIVLGLKQAYGLRITDSSQWKATDDLKARLYGSFRSRVGLLSYGVIARLVRNLLRSYDQEIWVWDPFMTTSEAEKENVRLASLEEVFRECQVVSLHTPLLPETRNLIRASHLRSMQKGAVFINTARGSIVNQAELAEVFRERPDLSAHLDVLETEPPPPGDPVLSLPNVWVTPHIAGSMGYECARMADYIHQAFRDYRAGRRSDLEVTQADLSSIA